MRKKQVRAGAAHRESDTVVGGRNAFASVALTGKRVGASLFGLHAGWAAAARHGANSQKPTRRAAAR